MSAPAGLGVLVLAAACAVAAVAVSALAVPVGFVLAAVVAVAHPVHGGAEQRCVAQGTHGKRAPALLVPGLREDSQAL